MTERIDFGRKGIFGNLILVGPELEVLNSNSGPSAKSQLAESQKLIENLGRLIRVRQI